MKQIENQKEQQGNQILTDIYINIYKQIIFC